MKNAPHEVLRKARAAKGFENATEAARRFGWKLYTYYSHENGTRGISKGAAQRYAKAFGIDARSLLGLSGVSAVPSRSVHLMHSHGAQLGAWHQLNLDTEPTEPPGCIIVAIPEGAQGVYRLLQMLDDSMNVVLKRNDYAIVKLIDGDFEPVATQYVVVERERAGLAETTIRLVVKRPDGKLGLRTHSKNPKLNDEIIYPSERPDEDVRLVAVVTGKQTSHI